MGDLSMIFQTCVLESLMLVCDASQSRPVLRFETRPKHSKHALTEIYNTNVLVTYFPAARPPKMAAETLGRSWATPNGVEESGIPYLDSPDQPPSSILVQRDLCGIVVPVPWHLGCWWHTESRTLLESAMVLRRHVTLAKLTVG